MPTSGLPNFNLIHSSLFILWNLNWPQTTCLKENLFFQTLGPISMAAATLFFYLIVLIKILKQATANAYSYLHSSNILCYARFKVNIEFAKSHCIVFFFYCCLGSTKWFYGNDCRNLVHSFLLSSPKPTL